MNKDLVTAKNYSTILDSVIDGDGFWKTTCTIQEKLIFNTGRVATESVSASSLDKDPDRASRTALEATLRMYREETFDKGFSSLVAARWKELDDTTETNPDTAP